jgi:hypothetical protein
MENSELVALKTELEAWRASKDRGRLIPEEIWQKAASLAKTVGVTKVHTELRLDFQRLKKCMGVSGKSTKVGRRAKTTFVKLPLSSSKIDECVLKVESVSGSRMQVELSGFETTGLSQLLREFAGS